MARHFSVPLTGTPDSEKRRGEERKIERDRKSKMKKEGVQDEKDAAEGGHGGERLIERERMERIWT